MRSWTACLLVSAVALAAMPQCTGPAAHPTAHGAGQPDPPREQERAAAPAPAPAPAQAQEQPKEKDSATDGDGPADAQALLAAFAKMVGLEARFEEEKVLSLLAAPLKSRGRIYFMPPGYLTRVVEAPEPARLTISPNELTLSGKDGEERIDLRQNDSVRLFVISLIQVFSGDEAALKRSYEVAFERGAEGAASWILTLTPREEPLNEMMKDLRLHGEGFTVGTIEVREPEGDRTVTRIVEANVERRFTDEEQKQLFGIEPR